jgi:hypothetical protein
MKLFESVLRCTPRDRWGCDTSVIKSQHLPIRNRIKVK